ncbi:RagB/SusD family nutrient uptake outer membrane protein [Aquimarina addita]|uniref:RagB/SusD family nutrient uptake outer membrane protein n=1 Tax=Aquimarina addita TaxID=870485 RepID=UPI003CD0B61B
MNAIRLSAGIVLPLKSISLEDILNERRKELCFEGHRIINLLRNNENLKIDNDTKSASR